MTCHYCTKISQYRLVTLTNPRWRALLGLPPREWHTCAEHRFDPLGARHRRDNNVVFHHD